MTNSGERQSLNFSGLGFLRYHNLLSFQCSYTYSSRFLKRCQYFTPKKANPLKYSAIYYFFSSTRRAYAHFFGKKSPRILRGPNFYIIRCLPEPIPALWLCSGLLFLYLWQSLGFLLRKSWQFPGLRPV